ncbi:hypothetical protein [Thalassotalea sp. PP2-459]|uniref:hypothetical protein n=1 Tax=Thalassotalea sp. PP2-459 TaxID=1742724 RepID=UPI000941EA83|nr:hypothetical protein [Thalassotalea sp. PP2-459]OKY27470.1 hypothetical protein BI291_09270 [Thalassotalea sp. PP2-459]
MQVILLWAAVLVSGLTFVIHTFIGGIKVATPLLEDTSLPIASKWLNYYCWHITTLYTFFMGWAYAFVALNPDKPELVVFLSVLNVSFSLLSVLVAMKANISPLRFPSTTLFALVSILGIASLVV